MHESFPSNCPSINNMTECNKSVIINNTESKEFMSWFASGGQKKGTGLLERTDLLITAFN